ncbi:hypothetical protein XENOCAPTIV_017547 [Xenoophorus captivus]|uniref:Uncharacterized protein n=1 Tax=Xenoophorus captivus TaxID=1517983 RepID=A0ABV0RCL4_9TELE
MPKDLLCGILLYSFPLCVRVSMIDCDCLTDCFLPPSLGLLLQDAPLSDCTDTIDGLDVSEGSYSPAKTIRKVLTATVMNRFYPYSGLQKSGQPRSKSVTGHNLHWEAKEGENWMQHFLDA